VVVAAVVVVVGAAVVAVVATVVAIAAVVVVAAGGSVVVSGGVEVEETAMVESVLSAQPLNRSSTRSTTADLTHPLYGADSGAQ
jgi:hypothetical protein